ncbi:putative ferric-chelate reductase 1 isoform X3 [Halichondria panicea]|uniref:putative ferric-chelate reductase 1 isoform X3 n=1 Tax=Halichondria panicea TaxID=6063 RepID=UPI00312BB8FF
MTGYKLLIACLAVCAALNRVDGFSSGPPVRSNEALVCQQMTPNPNNHGAPQSGDGGYRLEISPPMATATNGFTYQARTAYTIRLVGNNGGINGFLVQARLPGNAPGIGVNPMLLGSFQAGSGQQTLDCDLMAGAANEATIAHSQRQGDATSVQFTWTAPNMAGDVDFYYTVVRVQATHFDAISASQVGVTTAPVRSPDDYRFVRSHPEGCSRADCNVFIGIDTNAGDDRFLDIYMEGTAEGWVAVGFSDSPNMFSADVVACNRVDGDIVAIDGWNLPANTRDNIPDTLQDVTLYTSNYDPANTRLSCTVSKRIALNGAGEDLDLSTDLYVLYARRITASTSLDSLQSHAVNPAQPSTRAPSAVRYTVTTASTSAIPTMAPVRAPEDYRLQILSPTGCSRASCDLFIGIDTNTGDDGFLDIYMEGTAAGWVAVGFSETADMFNADVVTCVRNSTDDMISAWDAWNPQGPGRSNSIDTVQDVGLFNGSFVNGRISCTVSKRIVPSNSEDLNLDDSLYVIFARRTADNTLANGIMSHSGNGASAVSNARSSPANSRGVVGESVHTGNLIRAHGIFMIIAWPLLATIGIFFATFMRPALPNGEWFQVHRVLMLISLVITLIGFILIFVGLMGPVNTSGNLNLAHMIIGIVIVAFQITNPILALFRCKPDNKRRWIFNMVHGHMIGFWSQTLALMNCAFGLSIFTRDRSSTFGPPTPNQVPLWVFIAWIVFQVIILVGGAIFFSVYACKTKQSNCAHSSVRGFIREDKSQAMEMTSPGDKEKEVEGEPERKTPSKDSPLRWGAFIVYVGVSVPMLLAVIVMVAFP